MNLAEMMASAFRVTVPLRSLDSIVRAQPISRKWGRLFLDCANETINVTREFATRDIVHLVHLVRSKASHLAGTTISALVGTATIFKMVLVFAKMVRKTWYSPEAIANAITSVNLATATTGNANLVEKKLPMVATATATVSVTVGRASMESVPKAELFSEAKFAQRIPNAFLVIALYALGILVTAPRMWAKQ